ncbi:hypothetical protein [Vibrio sp. 10N.261.55.A7]|uniref:hypothetical protein n=1 Tax=Vibrio sp. 10N.261.55.A7 TaxID=1880851 RepID=UPI000C8342DF|nr:hypothetical protein [Vibrio sp. 10N.261.55.A7]PMJ98402.1 hypothetical protein BCU12_21810 [Vibrio sp. 10N.261.55.A7]
MFNVFKNRKRDDLRAAIKQELSIVLPIIPMENEILNNTMIDNVLNWSELYTSEKAVAGAIMALVRMDYEACEQWNHFRANAKQYACGKDLLDDAYAVLNDIIKLEVVMTVYSNGLGDYMTPAIVNVGLADSLANAIQDMRDATASVSKTIQAMEKLEA